MQISKKKMPPLAMTGGQPLRTAWDEVHESHIDGRYWVGSAHDALLPKHLGTEGCLVACLPNKDAITAAQMPDDRFGSLLRLAVHKRR